MVGVREIVVLERKEIYFFSGAPVSKLSIEGISRATKLESGWGEDISVVELRK